MQNKDFPFIRFIVKHGKINLTIISAVSVLLIIFVFLILPLEYTAQTTIIPSAASFSQGFAAKLGGLSKLAGFDMPGANAQSQEMYKGIISSRSLLQEIIYNEYKFLDADSMVRRNLITFFEIEEATEREENEKVLKKMREDVVSVNIDSENDLLYLDVTTENPFLSALVADKIVVILNKIVSTEVQKEFHLKQDYLRNRLLTINDSLKIAESNLKYFLETNTDPTLPKFQIEQLRLQRDLQIQTELLIEFRKQLEIFIADNMVNLADIKVLDKAYPPYRKSRPKRILVLISLGLLAGFLQVGVNGSIYIYRVLNTSLFGQNVND